MCGEDPCRWGDFCGRGEAPLRSRCSLRRPRGAVLHAVSTYDAGRRTFGREGCAMRVNAAAEGQLPQPIGSSLEREPCTTKSM